ncbi:MAG: FAD-binding protein [Coriobacteriia bacterium]|nr:FAD-binding protein [Coriobacteriia bacterium]
MIEIRNLSLPLSGGAASGKSYDLRRLRAAVARKLGCKPENLRECAVARRAVDARKKSDVHFVVTAHASVDGLTDELVVARARSKDVVVWDPRPLNLPHLPGGLSSDAERPVVVGAGCAGLFCALALAEAGCAPLLVERGDDADTRSSAVARFNEGGDLDTECNIQYGAGGAGTFSDGKLTTGTSSPSIPWVIDAFIAAGAPLDIAWEAHPHIGSDCLPRVVDALVARIRAAGGEVRFRTRMDEIVIEGGHVAGVRLSSTARPGEPGEGSTEFVSASRVVLACGHSARDVYANLVASGIELVRKTFAMGVRVEHPQVDIDQAQYGRLADHPSLPPAEYKLSCHLSDGRGVYTFCMCPGGSVVAAASEAGGVVTNGMSDFARAGVNANAALLANVTPADLPGDDPLAGVELQRSCERAAFELGGGDYRAPAQLLGDFLAGHASSGGMGTVHPTYPRGVTWGSVEPALPPYVAEALRAGIPQLTRRMPCFGMGEAVLTGVETRSSAPVRIPRGDNRQSTQVAGLYPCGEGAGYAGGIMSAATDGIATACALASDIEASRS